MAHKKASSSTQASPFDLDAFLTSVAVGKAIKEYRKKQAIFVQGSPADAVFYIKKGKVKLTVLSARGKEAVIAILGSGDFFGEGSLAGQPVRMATATAMTECSLLQVKKDAMMRMLRTEPKLSELFTSYLLSRNVRIEEDLVDQLFNSSERRLARILLLLTRFGKDGQHELVVPRISQETLAEMVGTTRSRVSFFMNKFRKLGFIEYNGGLQVHSSLMSIVLHD
jgi:CRP/FNR family transcriptional regulator, cyclic AMP receptor protein